MTKENKTEETALAPITDEGQGYQVVATAQETVYWDVQESGIIEGELVGSMDLTDHKTGELRKVLKILVVRPCMVRKKGGKESFLCEAGTLVYVGQRHKMKDLDPFLEPSAPRTMVLMRAGKSTNIGGGQTMWQFDIAQKPVELDD